MNILTTTNVLLLFILCVTFGLGFWACLALTEIERMMRARETSHHDRIGGEQR